jgi:NADPH-dependent 2,4-dienoyl-CoA reductase/sulfur reductase-like enzyme
MSATALTTKCCIVGGGPAGMMMGYLLARAGVDVVVQNRAIGPVFAGTAQPKPPLVLKLLDWFPALRGIPQATIVNMAK